MPRIKSSATVHLRAAIVCAVLFAMAADVHPAAAYASSGASGFLLPPKPSWWFRLRLTGYFHATEESPGQTQQSYQAYQHLAGAVTGLAKGRLGLRASARFRSDSHSDLSATDQSRLFTGFMEWRFQPQVRTRLGRQFVQAGVMGLTLDGIWISLRSDRHWEFKFWGGAQAPYDYGFEPGKMAEAKAVGGQIAFRPGRRVHVALSAAQRERDGQVAERPLGLELTFTPTRRLRVFGRAAYDFELKSYQRLEAQAQWRPSPVLPDLSLQFMDRYPSVDAASYFARFEGIKRIQLVRTTVHYEHRSRFGGEIEYFGSAIDERTWSRVGFAFLLPLGRIGYSIRFGDAGESSSVFGDLAHQVLPWLWIGGQATFLTYALIEDAPAEEERELTTLAARTRIKLPLRMMLTVELQSLENPFFSEDVRLLCGLDLAMGQGTSRIGHSRGGWVR